MTGGSPSGRAATYIRDDQLVRQRRRHSAPPWPSEGISVENPPSSASTTAGSASRRTRAGGAHPGPQKRLHQRRRPVGLGGDPRAASSATATTRSRDTGVLVPHPHRRREHALRHAASSATDDHRRHRQLTGNLHYNDFLIRNGATVTVNGTCRILCNGTFTPARATSARALRPRCTILGVSVNNTVNINQVTGNPDNVIAASPTPVSSSAEHQRLGPPGLPERAGRHRQQHAGLRPGDRNAACTTAARRAWAAARRASAAPPPWASSGHLDRMTAPDPARTHFLRVFTPTGPSRPPDA